MAMLIVGCTTPLRITTTDAAGAVKEIEVKNSNGSVVEVSNGLKTKIDSVKPAIEKEIKSVLEGKVKSGDFQKEYAISVDAIVAKNTSEPLSEEEKAVFQAMGEALTCEYVKQIVYPAWAKKLVAAVLPSAKAKFAEGDYEGSREAIWEIEKSGVVEVDELARKLGNRFLNKSVNPVQYVLLEKDLMARVHELIDAKNYAEARKTINGFAEIRTYAKSLDAAPAQTAEETEDTLNVIDGKPSGTLGTVAVNVRLAKLKEKQLAEVAAAGKAEFDAKMQSKLDELSANVKSLVESGNFDEARSAINNFASVEDTEWKVKIDAERAKLLDFVAAAKKAALDAKMQKFVDELTAKVIVLVENGAFDEARNTIRDVALVNDSEWDAKIYAARIGLMNSVVNPNQLKHLKAEAAKAIDDLVEQKKYAEANKYIDEYPYVHDTFAQIKESFDSIEKAMNGLKLDDEKAAEYVATRLAAVREMMEKRLGQYNGNEDYAELEKALGELEKGYVAQHYDDYAATSVTNTIKGEIVEMVNAKYAPLTTWEMNEALRRFLASKRPRTSAESAEEAKVAEPEPVIGEMSDEIDYDSQIAMAEAAIAEPASLYGLEAVLGDYARIMRRCRDGKAVEPSEATTMLVSSVFLNQPEMFKLALKLNADVNAAARRDDLACAPILLAVRLGRMEFVKLIRDANGKCDVADANGNTLLHYAAERGNLALVNAVIPAVKIDSVNKAGETALFTAVRRNQLAVAKVLLRLAGDADAQKKFVLIANGNGETAFDVACKSNAHMLLDTLVAAGAEYDEKNLAAALAADCIGVAQWLVEKGLDVNADVVRSVGEDPTKMGKGATRAYLIAEGMKPGMAKPTQTDK